jgi:hypothetical protein
MITSCATQVTSDGLSVWINAADGMCIARFGRMGIDVHRDYEGQQKLGKCLECSAGPTSLRDWRAFQTLVRRHYGVGVGDEHMPIFIREELMR